MPELSEIEYSRDACVQAVRDYYHFLTQMYLDDTDFVYPPDDDENGWPTINDENLADVDKDETVLDLLRHLPYVRQNPDDGGSDAIQVAPFTTITDWAADAALIADGSYDGESLKTATEGGTLCDVIPPHVVGLTAGPRDNNIFLVDTELGIVLWPECPGEVVKASRRSPLLPSSVRPVSDDPYDYEDDEEQAEWRGDSTAWSIPHFFEMLKDQFRTLEFVPITKTTVWVTHPYFHAQDAEVIVPAVREIYRKHHWPDLEQYDKAACQAEIQAYLRGNYPRFVE
ncbi:hypothetical protein SEUCBS139899_000869 [Sporothrix eucalyptigena]|uniref:Uncharacterized protein n=1 Tax=Sporothrix eucalyptigena TaxID=1812306 RepID=A0ABP0C034_9PEZI